MQVDTLTYNQRRMFKKTVIYINYFCITSFSSFFAICLVQRKEIYRKKMISSIYFEFVSFLVFISHQISMNLPFSPFPTMTVKLTFSLLQCVFSALSPCSLLYLSLLLSLSRPPHSRRHPHQACRPAYCSAPWWPFQHHVPQLNSRKSRG